MKNSIQKLQALVAARNIMQPDTHPGIHPVSLINARQGKLVNMKTMVKNLLCAMLCVASLSAFAANNGCHTQGTLTGNKIRQVFNYCLSNNGESDNTFKQVCHDLFDEQGGGAAEKSNDNTLRLNFVNSCPRAASGVCEGIFGHKVNLHILPGNDWHNTVSDKQFCEAAEGKWKP